MALVTLEEIYAHKKLSSDQLDKDLAKLLAYDASKPNRCFAGNAFLYHYQIKNLCKVRIRGKHSLVDIMTDPILYATHLQRTLDMKRTGAMPNRIYEAHRFNGGCVFFKPTTAKYVAKLFGATHMLDPCAGWGGRMLGAWAAGCEYTGYDTNIDMKFAYRRMISKMGLFPTDWETHRIRWQNFLTADLSDVLYDLVLTSPPYINLEVYPHMTPFESKSKYYTEFLIPLIRKSYLNIQWKGWVCINISPKMYKELTKDYGFPECQRQEPLLQQKRLGKDKMDMIYCWQKRRLGAAAEEDIKLTLPPKVDGRVITISEEPGALLSVPAPVLPEKQGCDRGVQRDVLSNKDEAHSAK